MSTNSLARGTKIEVLLRLIGTEYWKLKLAIA
jgi:hypothetical protein